MTLMSFPTKRMSSTKNQNTPFELLDVHSGTLHSSQIEGGDRVIEPQVLLSQRL